MNARELEDTLVRLSLDGKNQKTVGGLTGFPILACGGMVVYGCPKPVLAKDEFGRYNTKAGLAYIVADASGEPVSDFSGQRQYAGAMEATYEGFIERFGRLFDDNELQIEKPGDPLAGLIARL